MGVTRDESVTEKTLYFDVKQLPSFTRLQKDVHDVVRRSSWWELYGVEWVTILGAVGVFITGLFMLRSDSIVVTAVALFLMSCAFGTISNKGGHLAVHESMADSPAVNRFWVRVFGEFVGSFSYWMGEEIHIKYHHPHTNIIGLGDSSTWKAPFLSCLAYMLLAPASLPILTILVSISTLVENRKYVELLKYTVVCGAGLCCNFYLLVHVSGLTLPYAVLYTWLYRTILALPYLHVNIFQHIGLELHMWSQEKRPSTRLVQMSHGVLNLERNPLLDIVFGHSLISCHVEHHLFPRLSDHMCLRVKPIVRAYLKENGLPYHERSYLDRLRHFVDNYETLMVHAPPITHFAGLQ